MAHRYEWELILTGGIEGELPGKLEYLHAARMLGEEDSVETASAPSVEVALVAVPGLYEDVKDNGDREETLIELIEQAELLHDRLLLVDIPADLSDSPEGRQDANEAVAWVERLRTQVDPCSTCAAAFYHPQLKVLDPLGGIITPLRSVPCSGHVAGPISWLDRQRGAHHTPANSASRIPWM